MQYLESGIATNSVAGRHSLSAFPHHTATLIWYFIIDSRQCKRKDGRKEAEDGGFGESTENSLIDKGFKELMERFASYDTYGMKEYKDTFIVAHLWLSGHFRSG